MSTHLSDNETKLIAMYRYSIRVSRLNRGPKTIFPDYYFCWIIALLSVKGEKILMEEGLRRDEFSTLVENVEVEIVVDRRSKYSEYYGEVEREGGPELVTRKVTCDFMSRGCLQRFVDLAERIFEKCNHDVIEIKKEVELYLDERKQEDKKLKVRMRMKRRAAKEKLNTLKRLQHTMTAIKNRGGVCPVCQEKRPINKNYWIWVSLGSAKPELMCVRCSRSYVVKVKLEKRFIDLIFDRKSYLLRPTAIYDLLNGYSEKLVERSCYTCGRDKKSRWHLIGNYYVCHDCLSKLYHEYAPSKFDKLETVTIDTVKCLLTKMVQEKCAENSKSVENL